MSTTTARRPNFSGAVIGWAGILALLGILIFTIGTICNIVGINSAYYLLMAVIMVLFMWRYRHRQPGGNLTFGAIFSLSFQSVLYAGIIYTLYTFVYYHYIDPASFTRHIDTAIAQVKQQQVINDMTPDQIDTQVNTTRNMLNNSFIEVGISLLTFLGVALLIGLITAGLLRRERVAPAPVARS